jgi:hypothetical protein
MVNFGRILTGTSEYVQEKLEKRKRDIAEQKKEQEELELVRKQAAKEERYRMAPIIAKAQVRATAQQQMHPTRQPSKGIGVGGFTLKQPDFGGVGGMGLTTPSFGFGQKPKRTPKPTTETKVVGYDMWGRPLTKTIKIHPKKKIVGYAPIYK